MKTPKLTTRQKQAFNWMPEDKWIMPNEYAKTYNEQQVFNELHTMGLVEMKAGMPIDSFRKKTQKEIIEHYLNQK